MLNLISIKGDKDLEYSIISSLEDHIYTDTHWSGCWSCIDMLIYLAEDYILSDIEYLINMFESNLVSTQYDSINKTKKIFIMEEEVYYDKKIYKENE
jgi:hypothetical protein